MTQAIHLRRSKPLTALLADLLETPVPPEIRRKLAGLRADGRKLRGRPRKGSITLPEGATFGSAIVLSLLTRALSGDVLAIKLVTNLSDGLPSRRYELSADDVHNDPPLIIEKLMRMYAPKESKPEITDGNAA